MDCEEREALRTRIAALHAETAALEARLASLDRVDASGDARGAAAAVDRRESGARPMPLEDYRRYGRQMILKPIGLPGQLALRRARVLVVGAGGLGCPALLYLATAGIGHIGIVDHDTVELSNLHRQVLHTEASVELTKAESARRALLERNASINIVAHVSAFDEGLLHAYDLVLDCTDNAPTRHRINAACVDRGITLVSGAAIRTDGQLSVWNLPLGDGHRGPCYACVFPPSAEVDEASQRCEDEGVLGPVTGVIGTLMACEAIRVLVGAHDRLPKLTLFNALGNPPFRTMRLRGRQPGCGVCGSGPRPVFDAPVCAAPSVELSDDRVSAQKLDDRVAIVDVRTATEFGICSLPGSTQTDLAALLRDPASTVAALAPAATTIALVCRRGNDSLIAAQRLRSVPALANVRVCDLEGGLVAWSREVDPSFPLY